MAVKNGDEKDEKTVAIAVTIATSPNVRSAAPSTTRRSSIASGARTHPITASPSAHGMGTYVRARGIRNATMSGEDDATDERRRWGERPLVARDGADCEEKDAGVGCDEYEQRAQGTEIFADQIFGPPNGPREDREDRLEFELAIERGRPEDDGDDDAVEGNARRSEIAHDAEGAPERELSDDEAISRRREGEREEPVKHARTHGLSVSIQRDDADPVEHQVRRDVSRGNVTDPRRRRRASRPRSCSDSRRSGSSIRPREASGRGTGRRARSRPNTLRSPRSLDTSHPFGRR